MITGFDNIERSEYMNPSITTANINWYDYGIRIAELALNILRNKLHKNSFVISADIIKRQSTTK